MTTAPAKVHSKAYSFQLDIIKALAIIFVVAFHFFPGQLGWHLHIMPAGWFENYWQQSLQGGFFGFMAGLGQFLFSYLYVGVNFFVIASGFGLYLSQLRSGKPLKLKEFFVKRVWRLMPPVLFAIVFLFLIQGIFLGNWITHDISWNFFPFLGGLNLFSDKWFFPPIDGDTWFLGLIIQLYLLFPILVRLYEKIGKAKFLLLLLAISVIFRALYYHFLTQDITSLSYSFCLGRVFEFGFGMVLAKDFADGKKLSPWWIVAALCGLGYFWSWTFPFADGLFGVGAFALFWVLVSGLPSWKVWSRIAQQSYFIFLLHHPFIWILQKWGVPEEWSFFGILAFVLLIVFCYYLAKGSQMILDRIGPLVLRQKSSQKYAGPGSA
jgi:peptidoglycan/LPS O-acetylase OafA/YrhL